jgi:hypothetical protein
MSSERPTSLTPTSPSTIGNQCFVGGYPPGRSAQASGHSRRLRSCPRACGSKFNSSEEHSIMSEIHDFSTLIGQLVRPAALEARGYKFNNVLQRLSRTRRPKGVKHILDCENSPRNVSEVSYLTQTCRLT